MWLIKIWRYIIKKLPRILALENSKKVVEFRKLSLILYYCKILFACGSNGTKRWSKFCQNGNTILIHYFSEDKYTYKNYYGNVHSFIG